ncbi:hypothetical protein DFJ58DRAFT_729961 [Suillus subalutaceus]|uniref:uncharacterized protein n=1 Tax=Suillus subalutaceus TaxID=48586 RepID=UPI001B867300|nr:uncharacterized protein DFJ58DRAFT_729961 [Suillus subalutaceus]KAG1848059.1 hypothetical protein DFJ58DRAFT_729961 [Suillus subalutaceus]
MSSFVPGHFIEYPPPFGEEPSHQERPQDPGQTDLVISEMLQVTVNMILATLYFIITQLFRVATDSVPDPLNNTLQTLGEEPRYPGHTQDPEEIHSGVQQVVITAIHATGLTLGLRRIPTGFHVVVKTDGAEFQTSNKPVHVDQAVVEWTEPILLCVVFNLIFHARIEKDSRPCEPSSTVWVSMYASFELGPMLSHGEVLRTFKISI